MAEKKRTMMAQVVKKPYEMSYEEVAIPEIGSNDVLVKVIACGICGSDYSIYTGKYAADKLPLITGHEFFGTVDEVGDKVTGIKVGDRVAVDICLTCGTCYFCRRDDGLLCQTFTQLGIHTNGAFAEYVSAPAANCYLLPDEVDDELAVFVEPLTACLGASNKMNAPIASSLAVIGDGLGIIHGAIGKARGLAPVIVIGNNPERLAIAKQMGADYTICAKEVDDVVAEVMKLTEGIGVDNVIESVGSTKTYEQAFDMLRRGGQLQAFGITAQDDVANLRPYEFVLGEKKVNGSCAGIGNNWGEAITLLKYKRVDPRPMLSLAVPLSDLKEALLEKQENKALNKVIVMPGISERRTFD